MRLWHQDLIPLLPRQQLLGQHRECCALRGKGWGKKHATVDYVFEYSPMKLYQYHMIVIEEMIKRGYKPDETWTMPLYRGKSTVAYDKLDSVPIKKTIYEEHNDIYLEECLANLRYKGIEIQLT